MGQEFEQERVEALGCFHVGHVPDTGQALTAGAGDLPLQVSSDVVQIGQVELAHHDQGRRPDGGQLFRRGGPHMVRIVVEEVPARIFADNARQLRAGVWVVYSRLEWARCAKRHLARVVTGLEEPFRSQYADAVPGWMGVLETLAID